MVPLPRICLLRRPVQSGQKEYRGRSAAAQGLRGDLFALSSDGAATINSPNGGLSSIPLWGFFVFLLYTMRRVDCRRCGVVAVEEVPWGNGKRTLTKAYMLFLARWASISFQ